MSVILFNLDMFVKWLFVDLYFMDYRFVLLMEMVKVGLIFYDVNMEKIWEISVGIVKGDEDYVIFFCKEIIVDGYLVLVFCLIKNWCEKLVEIIVKYFVEIGNLVFVEGNNNSV